MLFFYSASQPFSEEYPEFLFTRFFAVSVPRLTLFSGVYFTLCRFRFLLCRSTTLGGLPGWQQFELSCLLRHVSRVRGISVIPIPSRKIPTRVHSCLSVSWTLEKKQLRLVLILPASHSSKLLALSCSCCRFGIFQTAASAFFRSCRLYIFFLGPATVLVFAHTRATR